MKHWVGLCVGGLLLGLFGTFLHTPLWIFLLGCGTFGWFYRRIVEGP
jgi:hypothetical protein